MFRISRRLIIILHDLFMAALAWLLAWVVRFNFTFPYMNWELSLKLIPEIVIIQGLIFWYFGLYRGLWRFSSLPDLWNIIKASLLGALAILVVLSLQLRLEGIPRSVTFLYPVFLIVLLGGPRLIYRVWKDRGLTIAAESQAIRVLILGAGRAGETLARDMLRSGQYKPVGFLDDDPGLRNTRVHGLPVYGGIELLANVIDQKNINLIVIAIPTATSKQMQRIVEVCEQVEVPVRTLPSLTNLVDGEPGIHDLRDLSVEDLLGRETVELDWHAITNIINNRVVLVSGGGGSIGSELCRQIAGLAPVRLVIMERSEYHLYRIVSELSNSFPDVSVDAVLGDICDSSLVDRVLDRCRPELIYHAAAYKHVPLLEQQSREGVRNNVVGTIRLGQAAIRHGCRKFVLISTDKAVKPVNILGKTKRIAELVCNYLDQQSDTCFMTVRFGNVLGSDGSVVPLFRDQIRAGGPVTVTHPDMERYFMTISEACQLIMQASAMGSGGEIYVLDMGQPVKILYLAEQMIRLSGRVPRRDIEILISGIRPGEKLSEELFHTHEYAMTTDNKKIMIARHDIHDYQHMGTLIDDLTVACENYDVVKLEVMVNTLLNTATPGQTNTSQQHFSGVTS